MYEYSFRPATTRARRTARLLAPALVAMTLAACNATTAPTARYEAPALDDYRLRHPIKVDPAPVTLAVDVHRGAKRLSRAQKSSVHAFARTYRANGSGVMALTVPTGGANAVAVEHAAHAIKAELGRAGVGHVDMHYVHAQPSAASTLALTYHAVGARVDGCGRWPADAALTGNAANTSYHNFGCASQRNLAAMVANPNDLVRPRAMTPGSATRRVNVVTTYGNAEPTTTTFDTSNETQASSVGQ